MKYRLLVAMALFGAVAGATAALRLATGAAMAHEAAECECACPPPPPPCASAEAQQAIEAARAAIQAAQQKAPGPATVKQ